MYKKMLAQDTLLYGIGRVSINIVSFLLLPLYTRVLGKEGYGMLSLFLAFSNFLIAFFTWGLPAAYTRFYFEVREKGINRLFSTVFWGITLLDIPFLIIIFLLRHNISMFLLKDSSTAYLILVVTLTTYLGAIHQLPYSYYQTTRQPTKYIIYRILHTSSVVIGNLIALFYFKAGVEGILYANLTVNVFFILVWIHIYTRPFRANISPELLKNALKFSIPLVFAALAQWVLSMTDRIFLARYTTMGDVGLYSLGMKISSIIQLGLIGPFMVAWPPIMFHIAKEKNNEELYKEALLYWSAILIICSSLIAIFSNEITIIIGGEEFLPAAPIIILTLAGRVLFGIYQFFIYGPSVEKKTHILATLTTAAALTNVGLNFITMPLWGKIGAAVSSLASYLVMCITLSLRTSLKRQISIPPAITAAGISLILLLPIPWFFMNSIAVWIKVLVALIAILSLLPTCIKALSKKPQN